MVYLSTKEVRDYSEKTGVGMVEARHIVLKKNLLEILEKDLNLREIQDIVKHLVSLT